MLTANRDWHTVLIRRNLTGNPFANGNGTDTERVPERERNGYRTGLERLSNGNGIDTERLRFTKMEEYVLQNTC